MPVDVANFLARNSPRFNPTAMEREQYQNALMRGQVRALPQQQALNDQRLRMNEQAMQNDQAALTEQQRTSAAGLLAQRFAAVAGSTSPKIAAQQFLADPNFKAAGSLLGLPIDQFTVTDQDTDDAIRASATDWARALGGQVAERENGGFTLGQGQTRYDAQGNVIAAAPADGLARDKYQLDADKLAFERDREGRLSTQLSTNLEKEMLEAQDLAFKSGSQSEELAVLANEFERNPQVIAGSAGNAWEAMKAAFGSEDAVSLLRRRYAAVVNSQVINNLPPGVASDRDIAIAREGFLPPSANPQQIAVFLRGLSKMERLNTEFNTFKADYIARNRKADGLIEAWKQRAVSAQGQQEMPTFATEAEASAAAAAGKIAPGTRISVGGVTGVWQ